MGNVNKTIALTDIEAAWIQAQIDSGMYANESEYIRDLIRSDQESRDHIAALRSALIEGVPLFSPSMSALRKAAM